MSPLWEVPGVAVGGLVGSVVGALVRELVEAGKRAKRLRRRGQEAFRVSFVQEQGANICSVAEQETEHLGDTQVYRIRLRFDLWSDRPASVRNIDVRYDWRSQPMEQHAWAGSQPDEVPMDASCRLRDPVPLDPGTALRLNINRRFLTTDFFESDYDEYRTVKVDCELASQEGGLERLTITGRLRPGGKIVDVEQTLRADDERARSAVGRGERASGR